MAGDLPTATLSANVITVTFADLAELSESALRSVLRAADPELARLALTGADERITRRVLALFPPREAEQLRRALDHLGPTRLSDVSVAQQALADLATQPAAEGRITIRPTRLSMAA